MSSLFLILFWIAGSSFSVGFCLDDTKGWDGFKMSIIFLIFWPLFLGCYLRSLMKDNNIKGLE